MDLLLKGVSTNQVKPVRVLDTPFKQKFFFSLLTARPCGEIHEASFFVLGRNTLQYFSLLILFYHSPLPYDIHVPNDRYI